MVLRHDRARRVFVIRQWHLFRGTPVVLGGEPLPAVMCHAAVSFRSWKGWDVKDILSGSVADSGDFAAACLNGGTNLGTLHDQRFYAIRANGAHLKLPFDAQPFTAFVDISHATDDAILQGYAQTLIDHGCVQAICRGEESDRLVDIFQRLTEQGSHDRNGKPFTVMCLDDEPLGEAIQYYVLPCGLAQTGLLMIIGDAGDFQGAIEGFSTAAGEVAETLGEPVYAEEDLVCFVTH